MSQFEAGNLLNRTEMSQNLRGSLQRAISYAFEQSHRQVTLEHLLLALADDREAGVILEASAVNVPALLTEVSDYLGRLEDRATGEPRQQPALGGDIQHIIQSAGAAAQKSKRNAVSSALVLAAIVGDGRSPSAQMLRNRGMTFESAIAALKQANIAETAASTGPAVAGPRPQPASSSSQPNQSEPNPIQPRPAIMEAYPQPSVSPQQRDTAASMPAGGGAAGVRLQNMQAAHEIIASARERIAAARGTVAAHAEDAGKSEPQPGPATTDRSAAMPKRSSEPDEVTAPPVLQVRPAVPANPPPQSATVPQPVAIPMPAAAVSRPANDIASPSNMAPQRETAVVKPVAGSSSRPAQQMPPNIVAPSSQPPPSRPLPVSPPAVSSRPPPQAVAQSMTLPTPPPDRAAPTQQPPVYQQAVPERSSAPSYGTGSGVRSTPQPKSSELAVAVRPIEPEKLAEFVPSRMRVGVPTTVEIRAPRARLEAWSSGIGDPYERDGQIITKAMVMRLKAPEGGFTVEIASPETQWSEGYMGPLSDDVVSWRWIVTPVRRGRRPLQLNVSTRVVGRDGLAAARTLPEQVVSVRVAPNYGRQAGRLAVWIFLALSGTALGYYGDRLFSMGSSMLAQVIQ